MFALEYAGWFDFLLPGLSALGIPIPLGGTSNHFRTRLLRSVHGWDAFNVTEDADLGVRLARQGWRVMPIDSSTFEEAIPTVRGWIGQRSRWLKGYIQTALVHLRAPKEFAETIGFWRFIGFVVFIGGAVSTALLAPLAWALGLFFLWQGNADVLGPYGGVVSVTSNICLIAGNLSLLLIAMAAPIKRRWWRLVGYGASVFVYWLLISIAAYKALWELKRRPHHWEKTRHGLARTFTDACLGTGPKP